jgi:hypothetical protein
MAAAEPATVAAPTDAEPAGDRTSTAPTEEDLRNLLERAATLMQTLLTRPDKAARQACEERAQSWLHDLAQAWVRTDACRGIRRSQTRANATGLAESSAPAHVPAEAPPLQPPRAGRSI